MAKRRTPPKAAPPNTQDSVFGRVLTERQQGAESRQPLIRQLENAIGLTVITFFTSFRHSAVIADADADIIEDILRNSNADRGLALIISSRGGSGLAAERIINVCRAYSGTREFLAIVPGKAKSAATLICLGASRIMMGPSSELGPVDPQIVYSDGVGNEQQFAAHSIMASYEQLFNDAVSTKGNLEPYLQQLQRYDPREIQEFKNEIELSHDLSVKALKAGMMRNSTEAQIDKKIAAFLEPKQLKSHGRPIFRDEARRSGLKIKYARVTSKNWQLIHEIYVRSFHFVNGGVTKCAESSTAAFATPLPRGAKT